MLTQFFVLLLIYLEFDCVKVVSHLQMCSVIWGELQTCHFFIFYFFCRQDSLFSPHGAHGDQDCSCSTVVLVILRRFRVNMSPWVRRMIASACLYDLHDQLIYLLPSLTPCAEHKALQRWILCPYYRTNSHF